MIEIGLIGYGELGKQFEHLIKFSFEDTRFIYFDDIAFNKGIENAFPFKDFSNITFANLSFLIGLGYKNLETKIDILRFLEKKKRKLYTFIHPAAYIDKTATIMEGCVVYPNVTIDKNVRIGQSCVINLASTISHDTEIGKCSYLSPSVTISGFVKIGRGVFLGAGVCVSDGIEIKDSAIIGIGTVVSKNISKGAHAIGNPQRIVQKINLR